MTRWKIEPLNAKVEQELTSLSTEIRARFVGICGLLHRYGPLSVELPHIICVKKILWEMRVNSKKGVTRVLFQCVRTRRLVALCVVPKTMNSGVDLALERAAQIFPATQPTGRTVKELHAHWKKNDPKYAKAYARVKIEMKRASNLIHARTQARLTQAQLAARLDATQAVISRIESGRFVPSREMLRRLCSATSAEIEVR